MQQQTQRGTPILRLRPDLEIFPHAPRAGRMWVVKDPLALRYFHFNEEEFAILGWLDGHRNLQQIKAEFDRHFAPLQVPLAHLHQFVVRLHRNGLVQSNAFGQSQHLLERWNQKRQADRRSILSNPLAIRFRGIDPDRMLNWLAPRLQFLFSPWMLAACVLLVASGLWLVLTNMTEFRSRLPQLEQLVAPANLLFLAVALALTKVLHEFGHALTCKQFGGECHEMGLMLLVFTPCLYVNVTDAWKFPSRRQRMAVSGAGILVELGLAAACSWLWWLSQPGLLQALCLNVMVVCSVGTVLLNGNPLLRYDGYYLLSDLLSVPNLWQTSRETLRRGMSWLFWGSHFGRSLSVPNRRPWMLMGYALSSMAYRAMVVTSILFLLYRILEPLGLTMVVQLLALMVLFAVVAPPVRSIGETLKNPMLRRYLRPTRVLFSIGLLVAAGLAFVYVPLPCRLAAPVTLQPLDARRIYISVPGRLVHAVAAGDHVESGSVLAELENIEVQRELQRVEGQLREQAIRVSNLKSLRGQQTSLAAQLPAAQEMLADLEVQQRQLAQDLEALRVVAPIAGCVLPPPKTQPVRAARQAGQALDIWSGTPLDAQNRGCTLERKTLLCLIGQPDRFEAVVELGQSDIAYVETGQAVRLRLNVAPGTFLTGKITEIARETSDARASEPPEANGIPQTQNAQALEGERKYLAHVQLAPTATPLLTGMQGQARIRLAPQSLGTRLQRWLRKHFKPIF